MSRRGRTAAARIKKRNGSKKARQQGDKVVRDAIHTMNTEAAEGAVEMKRSDSETDDVDGAEE